MFLQNLRLQCVWPRPPKFPRNGSENTAPTCKSQLRIFSFCNSLCGIADWMTLPVQCVQTFFHAAGMKIVEWKWWIELRGSAIDDAPPGISEDDASYKGRPYLFDEIVSSLREIRQAKRPKDVVRLKGWGSILRDAAHGICLPLHLSAAIVVPVSYFTSYLNFNEGHYRIIK